MIYITHKPIATCTTKQNKTRLTDVCFLAELYEIKSGKCSIWTQKWYFNMSALIWNILKQQVFSVHLVLPL